MASLRRSVAFRVGVWISVDQSRTQPTREFRDLPSTIARWGNLTTSVSNSERVTWTVLAHLLLRRGTFSAFPGGDRDVLGATFRAVAADFWFSDLIGHTSPSAAGSKARCEPPTLGSLAPSSSPTRCRSHRPRTRPRSLRARGSSTLARARSRSGRSCPRHA